MFLQIDSKCINDIVNLKGYGYEVKKSVLYEKKGRSILAILPDQR